VIESFACRQTERLFHGKTPKGLPDNIQRQALRKLYLLEAAGELADLRQPPGNRLEKLKGERKGQHSIRISGQWRLCFRWVKGKARDVEIVDYH